MQRGRERLAYTTNYFDTVILPAGDCAAVAKVSAKPGSVAGLQYAMLAGRAYEHTSDDVLPAVAATRKDVPEDARRAFRETFFSKGQPCFRASPLTKTHGWAIHADGEGRIALIDPNKPALHALTSNEGVKVVTAMRSKRA